MVTIQVSLLIIAIAFVALVSVLVVTLLKVKKALYILQGDLHDLSIETTALVAKLNELATDLNQKSQSLNFLIKPLKFFNKMSLLKNETNAEEASPIKETVSQLMEWITTSLILVKKTKEFIKHAK